MSIYLTSVMTNMALISFLALSAYLVLIVGEVSFGQQAFFGIGAYSAATATALYDLSLTTAVIIACILGCMVAWCLAKLTTALSGFYFSIATLAFAELFRFSMLQVRFSVEVDGQKTGPDGPEGFENIRWMFDQNMEASDFLFLVACVLFVTLTVLYLADKTPLFRSARIVGEDPILAQAQKISPDFVRTTMIALSGGVAAIGGALFAHFSTYIEPGMFSIMLGVHGLAYAVIGGLAVPFGPLLGVAIDIGLLESVRYFSSYRMIVFGGLVAVLLIVLPQGILNARLLRRLYYWGRRHEF